MCTFFIDCQSLRELQIMSVIIIAITQKDVCERFKCNSLLFFSQRGGKFKESTTHMLPHPPSPPPPTPPLSGSPSPLFIPPPPLLQSSAPAHLQGCSPVMMGDPSVVTGAVSYLMDQSCGKPCQSIGVGTSSDPTPSLRPLGVPEPGTPRQGEGGW